MFYYLSKIINMLIETTTVTELSVAIAGVLAAFAGVLKASSCANCEFGLLRGCRITSAGPAADAQPEDGLELPPSLAATSSSAPAHEPSSSEAVPSVVTQQPQPAPPSNGARTRPRALSPVATLPDTIESS